MENTSDKYQVFVANIHWSKKPLKNVKKTNKDSLPEYMSLDIPNQVLHEANKSKTNFNDVIESFCYNLLTKKFGWEVTGCQVWLPL